MNCWVISNDFLYEQYKIQCTCKESVEIGEFRVVSIQERSKPLVNKCNIAFEWYWTLIYVYVHTYIYTNIHMYIRMHIICMVCILYARTYTYMHTYIRLLQFCSSEQSPHWQNPSQTSYDLTQAPFKHRKSSS